MIKIPFRPSLTMLKTRPPPPFPSKVDFSFSKPAYNIEPFSPFLTKGAIRHRNKLDFDSPPSLPPLSPFVTFCVPLPPLLTLFCRPPSSSNAQTDHTVKQGWEVSFLWCKIAEYERTIQTFTQQPCNFCSCLISSGYCQRWPPPLVTILIPPPPPLPPRP